MVRYKSFNILDNSGLSPELSTCVVPWTLSTTEAAIFLGLVLVLAGAGTWASVANASGRARTPDSPATTPACRREFRSCGPRMGPSVRLVGAD